MWYCARDGGSAACQTGHTQRADMPALRFSARAGLELLQREAQAPILLGNLTHVSHGPFPAPGRLTSSQTQLAFCWMKLWAAAERRSSSSVMTPSLSLSNAARAPRSSMGTWFRSMTLASLFRLSRRSGGLSDGLGAAPSSSRSPSPSLRTRNRECGMSPPRHWDAAARDIGDD